LRFSSRGLLGCDAVSVSVGYQRFGGPSCPHGGVTVLRTSIWIFVALKISNFTIEILMKIQVLWSVIVIC